tara:strand:+ start:336 stop:509 length:174 start_codon:yes stop_codon:yes gene_type:complete
MNINTMKDYHAEISITFSECGEAKTEEEAIQLIKNIFYDKYGLHLTEEEIEIKLYNQ